MAPLLSAGTICTEFPNAPESELFRAVEKRAKGMTEGLMSTGQEVHRVSHGAVECERGLHHAPDSRLAQREQDLGIQWDRRTDY